MIYRQFLSLLIKNSDEKRNDAYSLGIPWVSLGESGCKRIQTWIDRIDRILYLLRTVIDRQYRSIQTPKILPIRFIHVNSPVAERRAGRLEWQDE